jgi:Xaa-Pro aminopeptidase
VDCLLVTTLPNVRYLTGFTGSAGALLVTEQNALLVTDGRYRTQAGEQLVGTRVEGAVDLFIGGAEAQRTALAARAGRAPGARIGLESENVTWGAQRRWADVLQPGTVVPTEAVVESLRQVKDPGEIARMQRAAQIADTALEEVLGDLRRGLSEAEIALHLDTAMRRLGAEDRAFDTIVASGPNAAKPHARPSARRVAPGDCVVVDFGATFDGYRSDMTRTFTVGGDPVGQLATVFDVVAAAQAAGVRAVVTGSTAGEVDRVCRELITKAGFGEAFEHGTGHGVGLDIHEAPTVGPGATAILTPGVVVTVEPGVYLSGVGGVRIEDTVVVTDGACLPLTCFPKDVAA